MPTPSPAPDRRDARVASAVELLRAGVAPTAVAERTRVPFALVEFLADHLDYPRQRRHGRLDAGFRTPSRARAARVSAPGRRSALPWARARLLVAVSLDLILAAVSAHDHRPVLAAVCLVLVCAAPMLPLVLVAVRYRPGRSPIGARPMRRAGRTGGA